MLVFDQYRGDYPTRFANVGGKRGFERLKAQGTWFDRCYYGYAATQTASGHATLLSGCNPHKSGIVANTFCMVYPRQCVNAARDTAGQATPQLLVVPTVGEILRRKESRSKVVGVGLKDRSVVLMCGNNANAVVFANENTGEWETSEYYQSPSWLDTVRQTCALTAYAGRTWQSSLPDRVPPANDDAPWEGSFSDGSRTFPHALADTGTRNVVADVLLSPYSLEALYNVVCTAIKAEGLGADNFTDILAIGASTTDYLGHTFGPDSREVQEMYVHTDKMVERLIDHLDSVVGRSRYVLAVTSDHGVASVPEYLTTTTPGVPPIDAGRLHSSAVKNVVDSVLSAQWGKPPTGWLTEVALPHIYLNPSAISWANATTSQVVTAAVQALQPMVGVGLAYSSKAVMQGQCPPHTTAELCKLLVHDVFDGRVGDVLVYPKPYWIVGSKPTTHGTPWDYDRWVPLMILGGGLGEGVNHSPVEPADLAPTLAKILGIELPSTDGHTLPSAIRE